jgi:signal recognition particle subunit SRP68
MDITKSVVSLREKALLYGDYSTYRLQLSGKLLNCRKKLNIATKNRGKFNPRTPVTPEQIAENHEYVYVEILFCCLGHRLTECLPLDMFTCSC